MLASLSHNVRNLCSDRNAVEVERWERGVVDRSERRVQFKGHELGEVLPCKYDRRNKTENPFPECSMRREDAQVPAFEGVPDLAWKCRR